MISLARGAKASLVDGCTVITTSTGGLAMLNGMASMMLEGLLAGSSPDEVAMGISGSHCVDPEMISDDLEALVRELSALHLVESRPEEDGC